MGARNYFAVITEDDCLNWCVLQLNCVGIDVGYNVDPVQCWPHYNVISYVESNVWVQPGMNSYQLLTRCEAEATTTGAPS